MTDQTGQGRTPLHARYARSARVPAITMSLGEKPKLIVGLYGLQIKKAGATYYRDGNR